MHRRVSFLYLVASLLGVLTPKPAASQNSALYNLLHPCGPNAKEAPPGYAYALGSCTPQPVNPCGDATTMVRLTGMLNDKIGEPDGPSERVSAVGGSAQSDWNTAGTTTLRCRANLTLVSGRHETGIISIVDAGGQTPLTVTWLPDAPPALTATISAPTQQQFATAKAQTRGYELISSVKDLILDGKILANRNAKIQITGLYKRVGGSERLYGQPYDAFQENDNYVPILTEGAQRDFRAFLLTQTCRPDYRSPGCQINVGGHMTKCHLLAAEFANYPEVPCLNIEVQIIYRPGD